MADSTPGICAVCGRQVTLLAVGEPAYPGWWQYECACGHGSYIMAESVATRDLETWRAAVERRLSRGKPRPQEDW